MSFTKEINSLTLNKNPNFLRLIEQIQKSLHEREQTKAQQDYRKIYSVNHYIEHIQRCINDNPSVGRALLRFYNTIKNLSSQKNQFPSTILFDNTSLKMSLEDKLSMDNIYRNNKENDSKISLITSQSTKSTTHLIQPVTSLMTKAIFTAINKTSRQRTTSDIETLVHLLNRCQRLRHKPSDVRHYAARSLLYLTYPSNTILTRQNFPSFLIYIIVYGSCKLLLETDETNIFGQELNIGDIYGDDAFELLMDHRVNTLITNANTSCYFIGFFSRDIQAYESYLSDRMKEKFLEQFRLQTKFLSVQWQNDVLDYFFKWSIYKQYSIDEIIYGNEKDEHENLYFILQGQVSFISLLDFPSIAIKYPKKSTEEISWRLLEIFVLTNGHYFGFESSTHHSWYLARSTVDIISIPKIHFKQIDSFAPIIFEKLRQDFLDIYPIETFIRQSYLKINNSNTKQTIFNNYQNDCSQKITQNLLSILFF